MTKFVKLCLQVTVQNQDEWDHLMNEQGLLGERYSAVTLTLFWRTPVPVIDVYSKWCGPCKAVIGLFRRIKNELGDDLLKFAIVRVAKIRL